MQKRTLHSLLIISFIVVFAASMSLANEVTIESKSNLLRCADQSVQVTVDVTADSVNAIECVFVIDEQDLCGFIHDINIVWELPSGVLSDRVIDLDSADGVAPDMIRFAAMRVDAGDGVLLQGDDQLVATIEFTTAECCEGTAIIDNTIFPYANPTGDITTQFVDAFDNSILAVAVNPGTIHMANVPPTIDPIDDDDIPWGETWTGTAAGDDDDLENGCEELKFYKVDGPADLVVNLDGTMQWPTEGEDVCDHEVTVKVVDNCLAEASTTFTICVTNEPPVITCPEDQLIWYGETMTATATAVDPDDGPWGPFYHLVSFDGPGTVMVDPLTGEITWNTELEAEYTGFFTMCIEATDSANTCECSPENADTCCFEIEVRSMAVTIEKVHNQPQGVEALVSVDMLGSAFNNWSIGGYDLVIQYDNSALTFEYAEEGEFFTDCGWEYFTYRYGADGNCGDACPSGLLRVVAMAEQNDGANHPDCYNNDGTDTDATQLTLLHFLVSNDRTLECQFVPIKFYWYDCGDNAFSDVGGDTLMLSRYVFDYIGAGGLDTYERIDGLSDNTFPTWYGTIDECFAGSGQEGKPIPVAVVDYYNGGIDIVCADSIDAPGDINLNGLCYEISDAVMFTRYFIEGLGAFEYPAGSIAASDVNKDGLTLTVADLVYLIRVVIGDAEPYPKDVAINATYTHEAGNVTVSDAEVAAMHLVVAGEVTPALEAAGMDMAYKFDGENTNIIVTPNLDASTMATCTGNIISGITGQIVSIEMADANGTKIAAKNVPARYSLSQNYPNPFNPTTTIEFALPGGGAWELAIYNMAGQLVDRFAGTAEPGVETVNWDASNLASGVYLYKLTTSEYSNVKKMILLK